MAFLIVEKLLTTTARRGWGAQIERISVQTWKLETGDDLIKLFGGRNFRF
jgi:hypothetical protein